MRWWGVVVLGLWACGSEPDDGGTTPNRRDAGPADLGVAPDSGAIDPCLRCSAVADCIGGTCRCRSGYQGNGFLCTNVDECTSNPCGPNSECTDTIGSYECSCAYGHVPSGAGCAPIDCQPCGLEYQCGSGECGQRYCDGRFGCYGADGCATIEQVGCTASGAWETCREASDCPATYYPGGPDALTFKCVAQSNGADRCWPVISTGHGQVAPPPITAPFDCPPLPPGVTGVQVERVQLDLCAEPPCEGSAHSPSYALCDLTCTGGAVCPAGLTCRGGRCR